MSSQPKTVKTVKDFKLRLQNRITWILAICLFVFLAVYLPRELQEKFARLYGDVKLTNQWLQVENITGFLTAASGIPLCFVLRWIVFAQDHLATSRSEASVLFRHYYPSNFYKHYHPEVEGTLITKMYFDMFNGWQKPEATDDEQDLFRRISERTYSLRLIWYLERVCLFFAIGAILMMSIECSLFNRATFLEFMPVKVAVCVLAFIIMIWLKLSNTFTKVENTSYFDRYEATGAYLKYKEIEGIAWETFKEYVEERIKKGKTSEPQGPK